MPSSPEQMRVVRKRLADGTIKSYFYPRHRQHEPRTVEPGSVDALIVAYKRSPEWTGLKLSTQKTYAHYLRDLDGFGHWKVVDARRRTLLGLRDVIATVRGKGAANVAMRVWATLFRWARDRDWIEHNPADRVRQLPGGHLLAWTAEEAEHAAARLPEALRRVIVLARYTGQRRGDLVAMTWAAYDGSSIRLTQEKTRAPLVVPVHAVLRRELDRWKAEAASLPVPPLHALTEPTGRRWTANHLTHVMKAALEGLGMRRGLNVHGLRKLAAVSLAEAGCSAHEIAAVTGHRSLAMVQLYTASAEQERLAGAAIVRLESVARNRNGNRGEDGK